MATSNQPFAACTEIEAIDEGAGAGVLGSTPARWLVASRQTRCASTSVQIRIAVLYRCEWARSALS